MLCALRRDGCETQCQVEQKKLDINMQLRTSSSVVAETVVATGTGTGTVNVQLLTTSYV